MKKVEKQLLEKQEWYDKQFAACIGIKKTDNPPVFTQQINNEREVRQLLPLHPGSSALAV